jgi:Rap1a immunity proteins
MNKSAAMALSAALLLANSAGAQVDGHQLQRFQQEAAALNDEKPDADRYRAGFYGGYLSGMLDALEGRGVCFKVCRCELDDRLARYLADNPAKRNQPASAWLATLLQEWYPCPK